MCTIITLDDGADEAVQARNGNDVVRVNDIQEAARLLTEKRADVAVMTTDTLQALVQHITSCAICGISVHDQNGGESADLNRATEKLRSITRSLQDARFKRQKQPA